MDEPGLGWEFLDRFATAIASTVPSEEGRTLRAMAFEVIAEEEAEEIALRHLMPALASFVLAYVSVHGSLEGIEEAGAMVDRRRALGAIFEETADLFRVRTEHLE